MAHRSFILWLFIGISRLASSALAASPCPSPVRRSDCSGFVLPANGLRPMYPGSQPPIRDALLAMAVEQKLEREFETRVVYSMKIPRALLSTSANRSRVRAAHRIPVVHGLLLDPRSRSRLLDSTVRAVRFTTGSRPVAAFSVSAC